MEERNYLKLKVHLLIDGVRIGNSFKIHHRAKMVSISEGLNIHLGDSVYVTAAINEESPLTIFEVNNGYRLSWGNEEYPIEIIVPPSTNNSFTSDGTPMEKVGTYQLDRARISAFKGCIFGVLNNECLFCEIGDLRKMRKNKLEHIREFVEWTEINHPRIMHYLVSGGTPSNKGWKHFVEVCKEIKNLTSKPIYAMFSPPNELSVIDDLVNSGVTEIAINLEFYDTKIVEQIIPGKAEIGRAKYFEALDYAVNKLGATGSVRSILIVGVEEYESTKFAVRELVKRGVAPILSVFKPLKGTKMESHAKPKAHELIELWNETQKICESHGLSLGPECPFCQNNTLTIPFESFKGTRL